MLRRSWHRSSCDAPYLDNHASPPIADRPRWEIRWFLVDIFEDRLRPASRRWDSGNLPGQVRRNERQIHARQPPLGESRKVESERAIATKAHPARRLIGMGTEAHYGPFLQSNGKAGNDGAGRRQKSPRRKSRRTGSNGGGHPPFSN
jgi:hypothetical protein